MNLKKLFQYGLIVPCLLSATIATDGRYEDKLEEEIKTFRRPTIEELHAHAKELKISPSWSAYAATVFILTTEEGVIFKPRLDPWDKNKDVVQRVLNLEKYDNACLVEKNGLLKKILFRYSPKEATDLTLKVKLKRMCIDPAKISYSTDILPQRISHSTDGTKYITFEDPNLIFTIHP